MLEEIVNTIEVASEVFENETLLITDPCYILTHEEWDTFFREVRRAGKDLNTNEVDLYLMEYLKETYGFTKGITYSTGYGDWSNAVLSTESGKEELISRFTADAGMVAVFTADDVTRLLVQRNEVACKSLRELNEEHYIATIPNFTGTVKMVQEVDSAGNYWTVIQGYNLKGDMVFRTLNTGERM